MGERVRESLLEKFGFDCVFQGKNELDWSRHPQQQGEKGKRPGVKDSRVRDSVLFCLERTGTQENRLENYSCLACGPILGQMAGRKLRSDSLTILSKSLW